MRPLPILLGTLLGIAAAGLASGHDERDYGRYDDTRYIGDPGGSLVCESRDYRVVRCPVRWRDARLVERLSGAECIRGRTWGLDRGGLWVSDGCRARFVAARGWYRDDDDDDDGWRPDAGWDRPFSLTCGSSDMRYRFCAADVGRGGGVWVERQLSESACVRGETWGWNRAGVWVDRGCRAVFRVDRRW
ncbi:hypothetical protein MBSD_n0350 [Mizugakiibacter sediminis]|uniref:DUF3011 domain-containing protein n=1 Tax=Mizugakiibacter sediminis TaxID=1475481 RepID=A0A0K8QKQ1_9GAMM|nr:DUF3011 domain-containing protein [Mizugakiibacter sediminis]GAP65062.1 hypothetical protein MBSD_n0350 [Mizugakiibacter sediminis]